MNWKDEKEDYQKIIDNINARKTDSHTKAYTRGWNTQGKKIQIGTRVFVYYAAKRKFIASGYTCGPIEEAKFNKKKRNWVPVTFDWLVDYDAEDQGLSYDKLKETTGLEIRLFEKKGQIQGGCAFLKKESDLDILERAWAEACTGYEKNKEGWMESIEGTNEGTYMQNEDTINEIMELLKERNQVILTGAPGTGKTYTAHKIAAKMLLDPNDPDYQDEEVIRKRIDEGKENRFAFVQFHPGYDYSDFVQGLKPELLKDESGITFNVRNGLFYDFCEKAKEQNGRPFVMVIDEINRADLSRVFGELFYGIESGYRNRPFSTQYTYLTNKKFAIPDNVYIIGTMNDIDRSVESMDFALRRRFGWREITAKESQSMLDTHIKDAALRNKIIKVMDGINKFITNMDKLNLEKSYELGAAYFKDLKEDTTDEWNKLWNTRLRIILDDYRRIGRNSNGISKDDFDGLRKDANQG